MRSVFAPPVEEAAAAAVPLAEDCVVDDDFAVSGTCELLLVPAVCVLAEIIGLLPKVSVK